MKIRGTIIIPEWREPETKYGFLYMCSHDGKNKERRFNKYYGILVPSGQLGAFDVVTHDGRIVTRGLADPNTYIFLYKDEFYKIKDIGVVFDNKVFLEEENDILAIQLFKNKVMEDFNKVKKMYEENIDYLNNLEGDLKND